MENRNENLRTDKEYVLGLRRLYESYGYKKFKMRKFEKYDLYLENKSFLRNANIVTVTDPKGRLLALKPDITLSIVKNVRSDALPLKVYYNESVYTADSDSGDIKENTQVGLEYIGDLDICAMAEILLLACKSLAAADEEYKIAISHMGFALEVLESSGLSETDRISASQLISDKNLHGLKTLCEKCNVGIGATERICKLITVCGTCSDVIEDIKSMVCGVNSDEGYNELVSIATIFGEFGLSDKIIVDFSVMNDMKYYNGLFFQGFIRDIPKSVLSGGRYDKLLTRFGVNTCAIGFAVYTDLLENFKRKDNNYDYDVFIQYSKDVKASAVLKKQVEITESGARCIAYSYEPEGLKYKCKIVLDSDGGVKYE